MIVKISNGAENSFWTKLVPPEYLYSKGSTRQLIRNGISYILDISDTVDHFIYFGFVDTAFDRIMSYVKQDDVIFDVGANIGRFTLVFASLAKRGKIISYEPDPDSFSALKSNVEINKFANVKLINKALGDSQGNLNLFKVNPHNSGMNRIGLFDISEFDSIAISVDTLDKELEHLNLERLDIIKIDVEGFEHKILLGAENTIKRFRPILFIELVDENLTDNDSSPDEVITWIKNQNYELFAASSMTRIENNVPFIKCHFDVICFPL